MNLRASIISLVAGATLVASTAVGVSAQSSTTSSVTIGGGNFSASVSSSNFASLPYSFSDQTARNGTIRVTVSDQTGDAGGWSVTLDISDFVGNLRPSEIIPSENLEILTDETTITIAADGSQAISPANMIPVYGEFDPELTWTANAGYGQGSYNLNMAADLLIPGLTTAQTYTSTGTLAIVTGP